MDWKSIFTLYWSMSIKKSEDSFFERIKLSDQGVQKQVCIMLIRKYERV